MTATASWPLPGTPTTAKGSSTHQALAVCLLCMGTSSVVSVPEAPGFQLRDWCRRCGLCKPMQALREVILSTPHPTTAQCPPLSWTLLCSPHTLGMSPQLLGSIRDEHRYSRFCSQTRAVRPAHAETLPWLMGCGASGGIQTRDTQQSGRSALLEHTLLSMGIRAPRLGEFQMLAGDWGTGDFRSPSGESSATGDCGLQLSSQSLTRELC